MFRGTWILMVAGSRSYEDTILKINKLPPRNVDLFFVCFKGPKRKGEEPRAACDRTLSQESVITAIRPRHCRRRCPPPSPSSPPPAPSSSSLLIVVSASSLTSAREAEALSTGARETGVADVVRASSPHPSLIREAGAAAKAALQRQRLRCEGGGSGRDGRGAALSSSVETDASSPMVSSGRNKKLMKRVMLVVPLLNSYMLF
jgi:hypothetical protein